MQRNGTLRCSMPKEWPKNQLYGLRGTQSDANAHNPTLSQCGHTKGPNWCPITIGQQNPCQHDGGTTGFSQSLIKHSHTSHVFILSRKLMTVWFFIHSKSKRAKAIALVDSGATENFMNLQYAKSLQLLTKHLEEPQKLFNIDGTQNRSGNLQFYTDLQVQTGSQHTNLRLFLTDLGENWAILGYPWFAATQP